MAFVQAKAGFGSGVSSIVVTFNSAVTAGNRIIAGIGSGDNQSSGVNSVSDSGVNSWHNDLANPGTGPCNNDVYSAPIVGGGGTTIGVTVQLSISDDFPVVLFEVSGLSSSSGAGAVRTTGFNFSNSGSATASATTAGTSTAGDYVFGFAHSDGQMNGTWSGANSCTLEASDNTHTYTFASVDKAAGGSTETAGASETVTTIPWSFSTVVYVGAPAVPAGGRREIRPGRVFNRRFYRAFRNPRIFTPPTASNTANAVSASDTLAALSDVATRALQAFTRTASDSPAAPADTATRSAQAPSRTAADTLGVLSDAATRALQAFARTASDTLSALSDAATRALQASARTASDTLSAVTDTAARAAQVAARTATDSLAAIADAATRALQASSRTASDTLGALSDVATRATQAFTRSGADSPG